jgi:hypothetical protein
VAAVPEAGAHAEKVLPGRGPFNRGPEAEERVVLYSTFPQMFASLLVPQPAKEKTVQCLFVSSFS